MKNLLEEYKKAYREVRKEKERKAFIIHLIVYVVVNSILVIANILYTPEVLWFFYPLIIWGVTGIVPHYLFAIRWLDKELSKEEEIAESRMWEK
ncbi:2TM domain-containing protein [Desulfurobacterium crinifex]